MGESGLCTNCGAELPEADALGLMTCPNCGTVTKMSLPTDPPPVPPVPPTASPSPPSAPTSSGWPAPPIAAPMPGSGWAQPAAVAGAPAPPPGGGGGSGTRTSSGSSSSGRTKVVGCGVVPFIIVAVVALSIFGAVRSCDTDSVRDAIEQGFQSNPSLMTLSGTATLLPGDGPAEVITTMQDQEDGQTVRRLARVKFTPEGSTLVWRSAPIDDSAGRLEVAPMGDRLFAAYEDQIFALDSATGETVWEGKLRDKVTTGCPSCFGVVRGRLIVRTTDAYVTAYGKTSSESLWSRRLNSTVGSTSIVGDRLFLVDDPEDSSQLTPVALVDPANGRTIRSTTPRCPENQNTPWDLEISPGDPIYAVPGSRDVVAAFGFGDGCVVRWNPDTAALQWTSRLTGMSSFDEEDIEIGPRDLVIGNNSNQLVTVYLPNGKARVLEVPADVMVTPGKIVERQLIGNSVTTRGTPRGGLIGWDLATGDRMWAQQSLGNAQPVSESAYHSSDALFEGSPRSLLVPVGQGINVFVFEGDPKTFTVRPLDLGTGELGSEVKRAYLTRYDSGTPSLTVEGVHGDQLLVSVDQLLQSIPVSGKGPVVSYPEKD